MKSNLCPTCLDEVMNASGEVRGIAGDEKKAAIHIDKAAGDSAQRESLGQRGT